MKHNHVLALVVAYYLSRFDAEAYEALGYATQKATNEAIGSRLQVNPNSVKNMRDEFDPIHDNERVGWYQREMRPSRKRIVELFQDLDEPSLREIVVVILQGDLQSEAHAVYEVLLSVGEQDRDTEDSDSIYIVRGPTGRKAEDFFIDYHNEIGLPVEGKLHDMRDYGVGYDFRVGTGDDVTYFEVKGLDNDTGGVSFTGKEWAVARKEGERYYLALVRNVGSEPSIELLQNPTEALSAIKNVYTSVQIRWNVNDNELRAKMN